MLRRVQLFVLRLLERLRDWNFGSQGGDVFFLSSLRNTEKLLTDASINQRRLERLTENKPFVIKFGSRWCHVNQFFLFGLLSLSGVWCRKTNNCSIRRNFSISSFEGSQRKQKRKQHLVSWKSPVVKRSMHLKPFRCRESAVLRVLNRRDRVKLLYLAFTSVKTNSRVSISQLVWTEHIW